MNADLPGAQAMLGAALLAQGYAAESIPHLEKVQADDLLGVALLEAGRPREAIDRLEAALQKRPQDEDLLYYLSQAHGRLSKQVFDRLRAESPGSARVQQMLGEASAASGNRDAAEKQFRSALALRPDLRSVHLTLGDMYLEGGDYERAEVEFRAEAEMVPGSAMAAYKLGAALLNRGRVREAIAELKRSDALLPDMPETLSGVGQGVGNRGRGARGDEIICACARVGKDLAAGRDGALPTGADLPEAGADSGRRSRDEALPTVARRAEVRWAAAAPVRRDSPHGELPVG